MPPGRRIYAVGDVHGRLDLFEELLDRIAIDNAASGPAAAEIVLLGDYIDRGPHSAQLLDRIAEGPPDGFDWVTLRGNHEQAFLDVLEQREDSPRRLAIWLANGGREALRSYGLASIIAYSDDFDAILAALRMVVPQRHYDVLNGLRLQHRAGDYFFVHAGVRPDVGLDEQAEADLLWIREPFLGSRQDHGAIIVHGHSISAEVEDCGNRIGIDTGAYATGRLTALVLEGASRRYLSTGS